MAVTVAATVEVAEVVVVVVMVVLVMVVVAVVFVLVVVVVFPDARGVSRGRWARRRWRAEGLWGAARHR